MSAVSGADELLEQHAVVTERRLRLFAREAEAFFELLLRPRHAHTLPATARAGLHDDWVACTSNPMIVVLLSFGD